MKIETYSKRKEGKSLTTSKINNTLLNHQVKEKSKEHAKLSQKNENTVGNSKSCSERKVYSNKYKYSNIKSSIKQSLYFKEPEKYTNLKDISLKNNPEVVQELIEKNIKCC